MKKILSSKWLFVLTVLFVPILPLFLILKYKHMQNHKKLRAVVVAYECFWCLLVCIHIRNVIDSWGKDDAVYVSSPLPISTSTSVTEDQTEAEPDDTTIGSENSLDPITDDWNNTDEVAESTPAVEDELSDFDKAVAENPDAVILSDGFLGPEILWDVEILETSVDIAQVTAYVERYNNNAISLIESGYDLGYVSIYVKFSVTLIQSQTGLSYKLDPDDFVFLDSNNDELDSNVIANNGFDKKIKIGDYATGGFVVQVQTDETPRVFLGDKEFN